MAIAPLIVDTHIHLFEPQRFAYHPAATYQAPPSTLADYAAFALPAGIQHAIIVHPEPYQDDHRFLSWCLANEPRKGFFKATCLFDPIAGATPRQLETLVNRHPGKIVALRIHQNQTLGQTPTTSGPIRDRDLRDPRLHAALDMAHHLGIAIQMHFIPAQAPRIRALCEKYPQVVFLLDHLGRAGQGSPAELEPLIALADFPRVILKCSGLSYSSKTPAPHPDLQPLLKRFFAAFGADRILWGTLGMNTKEFAIQRDAFEKLWSFVSPVQRDAIRGGNAARLFQLSPPTTR
jgi:L-fuconolactonase